MTASWVELTLQWVAENPVPALTVVFLASILESFPLLGFLIPGSLVLFAVGAFVGAEALALTPALVVATAGSSVGASLGYWLGRRYHARVLDLAPLRRRRQAVDGSYRFFARHGLWSIVLSRFIGPIRPVLPMVLGSARVPPGRYLPMELAASGAWAFVFMLPGIVFGASLELASEVGLRLVILLLLVLGVAWLALTLTRALVRVVQAHAGPAVERLLRWSERHRHLGRLGPALADPKQPEGPALLVLAAILLALTWLGMLAAWGMSPPYRPHWLDALGYQLLRDLATPWADDVARALAFLSEPASYGAVAVVVLVILAVSGRRRAAAHWLAALMFGAVLAAAINAFADIPRPVDFYRGEPSRGFAVGHLTLSTVIYAFLAVLLAVHHGPATRARYYGLVTLLIAFTGLARVYLGLQWLSLATIGIAAGLIWAGLLAMGYRRHAVERAPEQLVLSALGVTAVLLSLAPSALPTLGEQPRFVPAAAAVSLPLPVWRETGFERLPAYRVDLTGRLEHPLTLQWAGSLEAIRAELQAHGWREPPPLTHASVLRWFTRGMPIDELPILPQVHDGRHHALVLVRAETPDRQLVIRLWHSQARVADDALPLWLGNVSYQVVRDLFSFIRFPETHGRFARALEVLADELQTSLVAIARHPGGAAGTSGNPDWDGRILLLLAHPGQPVSLAAAPST